jgi:hypothetical protein
MPPPRSWLRYGTPPTVLVEHERRISPRVLSDLCLIREEAAAELGSRARGAI